MCVQIAEESMHSIVTNERGKYLLTDQVQSVGNADENDIEARRPLKDLSKNGIRFSVC